MNFIKTKESLLQSKLQREKIKNEINLESLISIDTKPSKRIRKKLEKDRFKKKVIYMKNKYEILKVKAMRREIIRGKSFKKKPKQVSSEEIEDLWADEKPISKAKRPSQG